MSKIDWNEGIKQPEPTRPSIKYLVRYSSFDNSPTWETFTGALFKCIKNPDIVYQFPQCIKAEISGSRVYQILIERSEKHNFYTIKSYDADNVIIMRLNLPINDFIMELINE